MCIVLILENLTIMNPSYSGQIESALVSCKLGVQLGKNRILESLEHLSTRVRLRKIMISLKKFLIKYIYIFQAIIGVNGKDFDKKLVEKVTQQLPENINSSLLSFSSCYNIEEKHFFEEMRQSSVHKVAEVANQGLKLIRSRQQFWSETSLLQLSIPKHNRIIYTYFLSFLYRQQF